MKRFFAGLLALVISTSLIACVHETSENQVAATTLPVYEWAQILCEGTDIHVARIITDDISCLHDYTLQVSQMRTLESSKAVIISGAGFEDFLADTLPDGITVIDASSNVTTICAESDVSHEHVHHHDTDPHIWLDPNNAAKMSETILNGLIATFPQHKDTFISNYATLSEKITNLQTYAREQLGELSCRKLVTFHDGFAYMAQSFDLQIVHAIEEESGSEASAAELIEIIQVVNLHALPAIFTETNGSDSAANIISRETGACIYTLDMAISGESYFDAMYHNIDTLKEALE